MIGFIPRPPAAPLIAFLSAVLAAWLFGSEMEHSARRPTSTLRATAEPDKKADTLRPISIQQVDGVAIAERPLLAKGRRAAAIDSSEASEPDSISSGDGTPESHESAPELALEPPPELRLLGVILSPDSKRALLQNQYDATEQWHSVGDSIQGWALVEITQSMVVLRAGADEITIQMFE